MFFFRPSTIAMLNFQISKSKMSEATIPESANDFHSTGIPYLGGSEIVLREQRPKSPFKKNTVYQMKI